jgi:uncharacterized protein (TIGR04255 family)
LTTQFANPPIVELIAEIRWPFYGSKEFQEAQAGSGFVIETPHFEIDAFLTRFGAAILALGYTSSERLVPQGVPSAPGQPVFRYRSPEHDGIMVQAGWGVATVNAVPPHYKSWTNFVPRLQEVLGALTEARGDDNQPYYHASVRYIDAFGAAWLNSMTPAAFARDILGFDVRLPRAIDTHRDAADAPQAAFQLTFPIKNGMRARVTVGEGVVNGNQALIYDTLLGIDEPVAATADAVLAALDEAHSIVHEMFEGVTAPIRDRMKPIEDSTDA